MDEPTKEQKIHECWFKIRNIESAINAWEYAVEKRGPKQGDSVKLWILRREREFLLQEILNLKQ